MAADDALMDLMEEFAARRARGERPDPLDYVARAGDRGEDMRDLLDRWLMAAPPSPPAPEVVTMMTALLRDEPPLLALRHRRALTLDAVAQGLVRRLGLTPEAAPRVRALYQRLEGGRIDLGSVRRRLRDALAGILDVDQRDIVSARASPQGPMFARGPEGWHDALEALPEDPLPGPASTDVDELFGLPPADPA